MAAIRPKRIEIAAAVTPTIPSFHPRMGKMSAMPATSRAVAMVMGRVVRATTKTPRWNERSTERNGSGTNTATGKRAYRAKSGLNPETVTNQKLAEG